MTDRTFGPRSMPTDWLARFREVEPTATMIDAGNGYWMVGSTQPGDPELARYGPKYAASRQPSVVRQGRAIRELGFAKIAVYSDSDLISGWAFEDFKVRNWRFSDRRRYLAHVNAQIDYHDDRHKSNEAQRRRERELMLREVWKYGLHRPISVGGPTNLN